MQLDVAFYHYSLSYYLIGAFKPECNICLKPVRNQSYKLKCHLCQCNVHLNCIPYMTRTDSTYIEREKNSWFCIKCNESIFPFNNIYEEEYFQEVIYENQIVKSIIPYDLLKSLETIFQPFELNNDSPVHSMLDERDPDLNFYQSQTQNLTQDCDYYIEDTLNKRLRNLKLNKNVFSLFHANLRSAPKNLKNLTSYLDLIDIKPPFIAATETWLKDVNVDRYGIKNYQAEHNLRQNKTGGGVSLFIKNGIDYNVREDLRLQNENAETLFIQVDKQYFGKKKDIIIGTVYRPPNTDIKIFNTHMEQLLKKIKAEGKIAYIGGDFNINLLNIDRHGPSNEHIDLLYSYGFFPCVTKPTRVSKTSSTLIDNIFTNNFSDISTTLSAILYTDISDHFPILFIDYSDYLNIPKQKYTKRIITNRNIEDFSNHLKNSNWDNIQSATDAQIAYNSFRAQYTTALNKYFPIKESFDGYSTRKPWLNENLKNCIKNKNKLYRIYRLTDSAYHEKIYKRYKAQLDKILSNTERQHYATLFEANKNNLKKSWTILKEIINKRKGAAGSTKFKVGNTVTMDKKIIASGFNDFFINVGPNLASKIPRDERSPTTFMGDRCKDNIWLSPVLEEDVVTIIKTLKEGSSGWDEISARIVKQTYAHFIKPLTKIMELSLTTGVVPIEMKIARVIPLFKSGDKCVFSNYRPVSVLPLFSKILERLMYNRLLDFINKHNLLYKYQFGFRKQHSPNLALIILVDKISEALDKGDFVLGLFLDFSKAFDTVNHDILFKKLEHCGIRGIALSWFKSYLSDRSQYIEYNGQKSEKGNISCGVPQGSILGPLLFLIYINDLSNVSKKIFALFFADDSNMFLTGKDPDKLIKEMRTEMIKVVDWLNINKLSLNLKKTHFMIFQKQNQKVLFSEKLIINNVNIGHVDKTKFLGVMIDKYLSFEHHITYIKGKIARAIGILRKCRPVLNNNTMRSMYNTFVYPYYTYCIEVWGFICNEKTLCCLIKLQKRALEIVSGCKKYSDSKPLFENLKILNLEKIYVYCIQLLMYKNNNDQIPKVVSNLFKRNSEIHNKDTRQSNLLHTPLIKTPQLSKTIRKTGVAIFNFFNKHININVSYAVYKSHVKKFLLENQTEKLVDNIIAHFC